MEMTIKLRITGTAPLLLQSDRLANPLHPLTKQLKAISGKKKKTDADHEDMAKIEFVGSLYFDDEIGPYLPTENIDASVAAGAAMIKRKTDIKRAYMTLGERVPLRYSGPRTIEKLMDDSRFIDARSVVIGQRRVMRTRPVFRGWSCEFEAMFDPLVIGREDLLDAVTRAGRYIGVGTYRPRFGRFDVEALDA